MFKVLCLYLKCFNIKTVTTFGSSIKDLWQQFYVIVVPALLYNAFISVNLIVTRNYCVGSVSSSMMLNLNIVSLENYKEDVCTTCLLNLDIAP